MAWFLLAILLLMLCLDPAEQDKYELLRMRLSGYVRAKGTMQVSSSLSSFVPLTPAEHEILLGTLKKVEAKNAAMVAVHTFFAGFLFSSLSGEAGTPRTMLYSIFLAFEIIFLAAAVVGVRQLDNYSLRKVLRKFGGKRDFDVQLKLQQDLMDDLLVKERLHRFSSLGGLVTVTSAAMMVFSISTCEFSARKFMLPAAVNGFCDNWGVEPVVKRGNDK
ncbi:hypothetical protein [Paracoccus niistensis]|uniref:Uncharacterized protein n=1 Tax=Paracoccus niistensis TaxID=632935 RepID=A0ABV6I608_9RHOB